MRMVLEGDSTHAPIGLPLLKAVARAQRWSQDLISGHVRSVSEMRSGNNSIAAAYIGCFGSDFCRRGSWRRPPKAASHLT